LIQFILILFTSVAFAQNNDGMPHFPNGSRPGKSVTGQNSTTNSQPPKKSPDSIIGQCVVIPGGGNLIASPCPEVILTLQGKGDPISTRTDRMGMYEFATEQGQQYKVLSGSKLYDVVQPKDPIFSGQKVEIHLKQKN